jgi:hypothetical protein
MIQRPSFLRPISVSKSVPPRTQQKAQTQLQFEKLHARIVSRDYADDAEVKLSLLSHELQLIFQLLIERN